MSSRSKRPKSSKVIPRDRGVVTRGSMVETKVNKLLTSKEVKK